jgi:N-acetylglucosaminyldiphosphoundecaprenol N-acetyl-beta-D-mannosaminyltransferase
MTTADDNPTATPTLDLSVAGDVWPLSSADDRRLAILGVYVTDVRRERAIGLLAEMLREEAPPARSVYFVNAHTLNLAAADAAYCRVLNAADYVFGDGTGVRWAARWQGIRLRDNLAGTDLVPQLFCFAANQGHRYFLVGGTELMIARAAATSARTFPGWTLAGFHHGHFDDSRQAAKAIRQINCARPNLLLVGMGNPLQEQWIDRHRHQLEVPLCIGVGGLFNYWAGNLRRSPRWLRRCGAEWLGILCQQPHKASRYLLGNPLFLWRVLRQRT